MTFTQVVFFWVTHFYLTHFLLRYPYFYSSMTIGYFFQHFSSPAAFQFAPWDAAGGANVRAVKSWLYRPFDPLLIHEAAASAAIRLHSPLFAVEG